MKPGDDHHQAQHRNRTIRLAVITSLFSKFGTMILRLISIPIAIRLLGMEEFGVYAAITMVVGMIDMMHVGIGPAMTQGIARAVAAGDREKETGLFATGFLMSAGLTLAVSVVLMALLIFVPIPVLFGEKFAPYEESMQWACGIAIVVIAIEMVCVVCDRVRDGYMETFYTNSWGAAGNLVGAIGLLAGIWFFESIIFLVLVINGSIALAKLGNTIQLICFQRPYLFPRLSKFRWPLAKPLLMDGIRFTVTAFNAIAEYNAVAYLVGRISGPAAAGIYAVMVTVHFSLTGVMQMVTIPAWPAVVDAHQRADFAWIRKTAQRLQLLGPAFAIAAGAGLIVLGPWALPMWAGDEFFLSRAGIAAFSAYFLMHLWRHVNQMLIQGIGLVGLSARMTAIESLLVVVVVSVALAQGADLAVVFMAITGSLVVASGWYYPSLFYRRIRREEVDRTSRDDAPPAPRPPGMSPSPDPVV